VWYRSITPELIAEALLEDVMNRMLPFPVADVGMAEIQHLLARWGELHFDIYANGVVVLSDTEVYQRRSVPSRVYRGTQLTEVLTDAVNSA